MEQQQPPAPRNPRQRLRKGNTYSAAARKRLNQGICIHAGCGQPLANKTQCTAHRKARTEAFRADKRARGSHYSKIEQIRLDQGLCRHINCGRPLATTSQCEPHRQERNAAARRRTALRSKQRKQAADT